MKRVLLSTPHIVALIIATGVLWTARGLMRLPIQEHASDSGIAWTSAMKGGRPWITALLCLVIAVGLTGLQEKKWGSSVSNAMVWPVIFWAFSAAKRYLALRRRGARTTKGDLV